MTDHADFPRLQASAPGQTQGATASAEQVIRRMLLRWGIHIEPEHARLMADAVMVVYQASLPAATAPQAGPGGP